MKKKQLDTLARMTCDELEARGYRRPTIKDMRLHIACIMDAIRELHQARDTRPAYDPIHATRYYSDNGAAYCTAQTIIFNYAPIAQAQAQAAAHRRALMMDAGTWTEAHERAYLTNY